MIKKLPKSQIEFEVRVPWEDWKPYLDQVAREISEELKIPGFRPGKAPRNLVEQKVGKSAVLRQAIEKAVHKSYVEFVMARTMEVIGAPEVEVGEAEEGKELVYTARASVVPELSLREGYEASIQEINKKYKEKTPEVNEEEVMIELEKLSHSRAKLVTVRREARKNDSVEIDFSVSIGGVPIENGSGKNHPLIIGRGVFIPGFEDNLAGMAEGEEKEFELKFPGDYHKKDFANKPALFKVKMNLVQEREVPEINDDFAKSLGNFENLEAFKKSMREGMRKENEKKLQEKRRTEYIEKLIEGAMVELPYVLVEKEVARMMQEFGHQIQSMGMDMEEYLRQIKKEKAELEKEWHPQAEKRVKSALILKEIAKKEKIEATPQEVEEEVNKTLHYYKSVKEVEKRLDVERLYTYAKGMLENEKVFGYLEKM